ncbi:hypothetical protein A5881_002120 [Enterococcus termitis]|nr:hypothetical protein A5881_001559 [Enterococcus termitis]
MKKLIQSSICLLLLVVSFYGTTIEASGKTQSDITFIQGEQPKKPIIDTIFSGNKKGIFPRTGEQLNLYLLIIGVCLLIFIYLGFHLKNKNTRKKEQE